jgi:hypothetical protein
MMIQMNNETPTPTPSIAELWREFQSFETKKMRECPECGWHGGYHQAKCTGAENTNANEWPLTFPAMRAEEFKILRAQLLERCKQVHDVDGFTSMFEIDEERRIVNTYLQDRRGYSTRHPRCDDAETSANYVAAVSFWVWELEHLAKES